MKNKKMGYVLIVIGILLVITGGWMVCSKITTSTTEAGSAVQMVNSETVAGESLKKTEETDETDETSVSQKAENNDLTEAQEKGRAFEEYVVSHFNKKYFKLKEWRGDKYYKGNYAESSHYPDLEYEFSFKGKTTPFAVECKWRSEFKNGWVTWSTEEQAAHYRQFEKETGKPVFVMIGIGGTPTSPAHVYVVPLKSLKLTDANEDYISKYKREDNEKAFYFDVENLQIW